MRSFGSVQGAVSWAGATALLVGTSAVLSAPAAFAVAAPGVGVTTASGLAGTGATLKATIAPNGASTTVTAACTGGPFTASSTTVSGSGQVPVTITLSGLTGAGKYICSLKATSSGGTATGASKAAFYSVAPPLTAVTLYVDGTPDAFGGGTRTTGCTGPGADACMTVQQGVNAAQALTNRSVTLEVVAPHGFGGDQPYYEGVSIALPDTVRLRVQGVNNPIIGGQLQGKSVFTVTGTTGLSGSAPRVILDGLTITGGDGAGTSAGGVTVAGDLVQLSNDTITANRAVAGAGVFNNSTNTLTMINDTVSNNVTGTGGGAPTGVAVLTLQGTTVLIHNTLANNPPTGVGTGLDIGGTGSYRLVNSLLSHTSCGNVPAQADGGRNVESANTCGLAPATNLVNSAGLNLATTLAANGSTGPRTLAIGEDSTAHNEVPAAACTVSTDERGFTRPGFAGQGCDAGAFELQAAPVAPTVGTTTSSALTATTATVNATVNPGGAPTTATASCTGGPFVASTDGVGSGRAGTPSAVTLTGLSAATEYSCALVATNGAGSATSATPAVFTTPAAAPQVNSASASAVTATTATLSAPVNPAGAATTVTGTCTGGPFTAGSTDAGAAGTPSTASVDLSGLAPGTAYTCAVRATNSFGTTTSSGPATFTTDAAAPSVGETSASGIGIGVATVTAPVTPAGAATTVTATCTGGPFTAGTVPGGSGTSAANRSVPLSGLTAATAYSCAVTATNSAGTTASATPAMFTTAAAAAPVVTGTTAPAVGTTTATLGSSVTARGAATTVTAACTGGAFTASSQGIGADTDPQDVVVSLTGLTAGTAYSCRVTASNSAGVTTSATPAAFTTAAAPTSPAPPAAPPGSTSSTSASSGSPSGTATAANNGVTASGQGVGALTVAGYSTNPRVDPPFSVGSGGYFDVHVAPGSAFSSLTIINTNLHGGDTLFWFDDAAHSWRALDPQTYNPGPPATIAVTLSSTSTPTIAQLTGTVFAVAKAKAKIKVDAKTIKATRNRSGTDTVATFTDKDNGPAKGYRATVSWGDGTTSKGTVVRTSTGHYKVTGKHKYHHAGTKVTTVKVTDAAGQSSRDHGKAKVKRKH